MKCPRCIQDIQVPSSLCPHCGLSLSVLDHDFGDDFVLLEKLTDSDGVLEAAEGRKLRRQIEMFESRFPQLFFATFIGTLPELTNIRQFGFWLLNRAAVTGIDHMRPNENGLLLLIDLGAGTACLTPGYFVEPYLRDFELDACLKAGLSSLRSEKYGKAIGQMLAKMSLTLETNWRRAQKHPDNYQTVREMKKEPLFQKIRPSSGQPGRVQGTNTAIVGGAVSEGDPAILHNQRPAPLIGS